MNTNEMYNSFKYAYTYIITFTMFYVLYNQNVVIDLLFIFKVTYVLYILKTVRVYYCCSLSMSISIFVIILYVPISIKKLPTKTK